METVEVDEVQDAENYSLTSPQPFLASTISGGFPVACCPSSLPDLSQHHSTAACVLRANEAIYDDLKESLTPFGVNFACCIKSGMDNRSHPAVKTVGAAAGDEYCYETFGAFFRPLLMELHGSTAVSEPHAQARRKPFMEAVSALPVDPAGRHVLRCHCRASRNLKGFCFPPTIAKSERCTVERLLSTACLAVEEEELRGSYTSLAGLEEEGGSTSSRALPEAFVFPAPDAPNAISSGLARDWPDGRGVFVNQSQSICCWINEEDHLRACSSASDLQQAFGQLVSLLEAVEANLQQNSSDEGMGTKGPISFAWSDQLGYLSSDPANVGTALQASAVVKLPFLSEKDSLAQWCHRQHLQLRKAYMDRGGGREEEPAQEQEDSLGTANNRVASTEAGLVEVSTKQQLGVSEVSVINSLIDALATLVIAEQHLETTGEDVLLHEACPQNVDGGASERTASLVRGGSSELGDDIVLGEASPVDDTWKAAGEALEHLFLATVESGALDDHEEEDANICTDSPNIIQGQLAEELLAAVEDAALADLIVGKTEDTAGDGGSGGGGAPSAGRGQGQGQDQEQGEGAATLAPELTRATPSEPELIEVVDDEEDVVEAEKTAWPTSEATELPATTAPPPEDEGHELLGQPPCLDLLRAQIRDAFSVASLDGSLENVLSGILPGPESGVALAQAGPAAALEGGQQVVAPLRLQIATLLVAAEQDGSLVLALESLAKEKQSEADAAAPAPAPAPTPTPTPTPVPAQVSAPAPAAAATISDAEKEDLTNNDTQPVAKIQVQKTVGGTKLTARNLLLTMSSSSRRLGCLTSELKRLEEAIATRDAQAEQLKTQLQAVQNEGDNLGEELARARERVAEQEILSFKLQASLWTGRSGVSTACSLQDADESAKTLPFPKEAAEESSRPPLQGTESR